MKCQYLDHALKTTMERIRLLHNKLQMMGIPLDDPSVMLWENNVIKSLSRHESTLKKKTLPICYHMIREVAMLLVKPG